MIQRHNLMIRNCHHHILRRKELEDEELLVHYYQIQQHFLADYCHNFQLMTDGIVADYCNRFLLTELELDEGLVAVGWIHSHHHHRKGLVLVSQMIDPVAIDHSLMTILVGLLILQRILQRWKELMDEIVVVETIRIHRRKDGEGLLGHYHNWVKPTVFVVDHHMILVVVVVGLMIHILLTKMDEEEAAEFHRIHHLRKELELAVVHYHILVVVVVVRMSHNLSRKVPVQWG